MKLVPSLALVALSLAPSTAALPTGQPRPTAAHLDSAITAAREALGAGRPWRATRLLAPLLRDSALRTPEVEYLAARAAVGWQGWRETTRLLGSAGWLDTDFGGEGHELLARAWLGLGKDSNAVPSARRAVDQASSDSARGARLVLLGLASEGAGDWAGALAAWTAARPLLPSIGDWLAVRAIAVTPDSAGRAALSATILDSLPRSRWPLADATGFLRAGDSAGAITRFASAGSSIRALQLRYAMADSAGRAGLRNELVAFIEDRSGTSAARSAVSLLDSLGLPLTLAEHLTIARSATRSGPLARASKAYGAAFAIREPTAEERYALAEVYFRQGRYDEAIAQYRKVRAPSSLAAAASYRAARSMVRDGRAGEGRTVLGQIVKKWPRDSSAAQALYLLADLSTDDRHDGEARRYYARIVREHPKSRLAAPAAFRAGLIAFADGRLEVAGTEFDALEKRYPNHNEATAAVYWAGRAWGAAGDEARARERWGEVIARDSASYYADLSARRLGLAAWAPAIVPDTFVAVPELDRGVARAALLAHLMLDDEARAERARVGREARGSAEQLLAAAHLLQQQGYPSEAITLARRAQSAGAAGDARLYRLLYPLGFPLALMGESERNGVDPTLVAALIRQESLFNPAATSSAGARGLMQVMPDLGRRVARGLGYEGWDPVLLWEGDANLEIGTTHLKELVDAQGNLVEVLAAYNAGAHRVARWRTRLGADDQELFAERIPFVETRDYVRIIQRNQALYRALYPAVASHAQGG